jgi:hypothetical protein
MLVMRRTFKKVDSDGSGFLARDEILNAASCEAEVDVKTISGENRRPVRNH